MDKLEEDLGEVTVQFDTTRTKDLDLPESYKSNTPKEKVLLKYAENFQRQFKQLYADRKRLLLSPPNECGIEKFICTTLRPTYLKYKELYDYDGCAAFVADYLTYHPYIEDTELPQTVSSSMTVLHTQKGHCFDYAILLASLLVGVGYDAYCVLGYASNEVCTMNLSRKPCPMLDEQPEAANKDEHEKRGRYTVRATRDFTSNFERRLENKEKARIENEERMRKEEERRKIMEAEAPPKDEFHGLRVHCWILVLMGKREITQSFFIEPTTGETHPLDWEEYLGIESLWNHRNYWVNMQDCSSGVKDMTYDLGDGATWEPFFPNVDKPLLVLPGEEPSVVPDDSEEKLTKDIKDPFQLPPSWTLPIFISPQNLESRCPKGSKTLMYYRAQMDKYADYLNSDGLTSKLTVFNDTARTQQKQLRLSYKHRSDLLKSRIKTLNSGEVSEYFSEGRLKSLKSHTFYDSNPLRENNRVLEFYPHARVDCLTKREFNSKEMIEHFQNRSDFLYYRHVTYEPAPRKRVERTPLNIVKIVEKFHPNPAIAPNDNKAEIHYMLGKNRIKVVYQLEKERITASTIEYQTPPIVIDQAALLTYNPDEIYLYQVDPYRKPAKNRETFEQLEKLVQSQEVSIKLVRDSEEETMQILKARDEEESNISLKISVYDVVRNETARRHKEEIELKRAEEERIRKEKEMDYLAPFLARIGDPPKLTKEQMMEVSQACLRDMRNRLVTMANLIRVRFEEETEKLQRMQAWYKSKQGSLTKEEESEYMAFCSSCMFTLHILETRLAAHKASAPVKYMKLEERLKKDSRVAYFYI